MIGARGSVVVRFETKDGLVKWRELKASELDHRSLCLAAGLYEGTTTFDVPKSFQGGSGRGNRRIEGVIMQDRGKGPEPIGKITLVEQGERFKDEDPRAEWARIGA